MTIDEAQTHRGDWAAVTEKTRAVLKDSRLFRDVHISDPHEGPDGEVAVEIGSWFASGGRTSRESTRRKDAMPTIVEYTNRKLPENLYPWHIVSPADSGPCCFSAMEEIGDAQREERWEYVYKRCRVCGFTVQMILRRVPDEALIASLRKELELSFRRNPPE